MYVTHHQTYRTAELGHSFRQLTDAPTLTFRHLPTEEWTQLSPCGYDGNLPSIYT